MGETSAISVKSQIPKTPDESLCHRPNSWAPGRALWDTPLKTRMFAVLNIARMKNQTFYNMILHIALTKTVCLTMKPRSNGWRAKITLMPIWLGPVTRQGRANKQTKKVPLWAHLVLCWHTTFLFCKGNLLFYKFIVT